MKLRGLLLASAIAVLLACEKPPAPSPAPGAGLPAGLFVAAAPPGARSVDAVKAAAKVGDEVVVAGQVGGRRQWTVDGQAIFLLVNPALDSCNEIEGDDCATPWDFCCVPKEEITKNLATVRIVDAGGKPLAQSLAGRADLKPLAHVVVAGKVHGNAEGNLVIDARQIHLSAK